MLGALTLETTCRPSPPPRATINLVLRRYETRTNWGVGVGLCLIALSAQSRVVEDHPLGPWPWLCGLFAGLGVIPTIYGCVNYAKGKGHSAGLGGVLGAALALGFVMVAVSPSQPALGLPSSLALIVLALLPNRHKRGAQESQSSPGY